MPESQPTTTYRCACCGQTFEKGWSDAEAQAEAAQAFGVTTTENCALVCDDCYQDLMERMDAWDADD
jgi:hypothetical protein